MPLLYEKKGHIGLITLSRPQARNAWGDDFRDPLCKLLDEIEADDGIRCVILTGDDEGKAFSAGADLKNPKTHTNSSVAEITGRLAKRRFHSIHAIADFPKPLIAAVNGYAIGIGCIVTFCCDMIVASERAEWRLPQVNLGILPALGGLPRLARWIGKGHAMRLAMGLPIKANEAYRIGLAQWVVPHDDLMSTAFDLAVRIGENPPLAARLAKDSLNSGMDIANIGDASMVDIYRFALLELTEDAKESHRAWREKRKPSFKGR